jgi:geranylgeranyl diphosphate synthase, type I
MNWLHQSLSEVQSLVRNAIPFDWPELHSIAAAYFNQAAIPELIVPVSCCKAVGGNVEHGASVFAAIAAASISARIFDDIQDQDKKDALYLEVGLSRALNYADAFRTTCFKLIGDCAFANSKNRQLYQTFITCYFNALRANERELKGTYTSWAEAWKTIKMKSGHIYAAIAYMGALCGTSNELHTGACRQYGYHFGIAIQFFNDLEGVWETDNMQDIAQGKITLPLLYALNCEHPWKEELTQLIAHQNNLSTTQRIKEILDAIDAKQYLVWAALQERTKALEALSPLESNEGKTALEAHFTGMFGDINELLQIPEATPEIHMPAAALFAPLTDEESNAENNEATYHSQALHIRNKLAQNRY